MVSKIGYSNDRLVSILSPLSSGNVRKGGGDDDDDTQYITNEAAPDGLLTPRVLHNSQRPDPAAQSLGGVPSTRRRGRKKKTELESLLESSPVRSSWYTTGSNTPPGDQPQPPPPPSLPPSLPPLPLQSPALLNDVRECRVTRRVARLLESGAIDTPVPVHAADYSRLLGRTAFSHIDPPIPYRMQLRHLPPENCSVQSAVQDPSPLPNCGRSFRLRFGHEPLAAEPHAPLEGQQRPKDVTLFCVFSNFVCELGGVFRGHLVRLRRLEVFQRASVFFARAGSLLLLAAMWMLHGVSLVLGAFGVLKKSPKRCCLGALGLLAAGVLLMFAVASTRSGRSFRVETRNGFGSLLARQSQLETEFYKRAAESATTLKGLAEQDYQAKMEAASLNETLKAELSKSLADLRADLTAAFDAKVSTVYLSVGARADGAGDGPPPESFLMAFDGYKQRIDAIDASISQVAPAMALLNKKIRLLEEKSDRVSSVLEALQQRSQQSDGGGETDHCLSLNGASVVDPLTTPSYRSPMVLSFLGIGIHGKPAITALSPNNSLGNCWSFRGARGQLTVRLSAKIVPSSFGISHVAIESALTPSTAPRDVEVYGLGDDFNDCVLLCKYSFDPQAGHSQRFDVASDSGAPFAHFQLRILSNNGHPKFTCLYKLRIYGKPVQ